MGRGEGGGGGTLIQTKEKRVAREQRNKYKPRTETCTNQEQKQEQHLPIRHAGRNFVPRVLPELKRYCLCPPPHVVIHISIWDLCTCASNTCASPPRPAPPRLPTPPPQPSPYNLYVCPRLVILMFWRGSFLKIYACMHNDNFCK